jgi:hypothetical protein
MAKEELSAREKALLAEARREAAAHKDARPLGQDSGRIPAAPQAKPAPTQAERLAQLMADERADTRRRKIRMRRYGLTIAGGIGALFILWLLRAFRPRR